MKQYSTNHDYDTISTPPGRVQTFLSHPERRTLPVSCTLRVWNGNLADILGKMALDLKANCGCKLVLDGYEKTEAPYLKGKVSLYLGDHEDVHYALDYGQFSLAQEKEGPVIEVADSMMDEDGYQGIISSWFTLLELFEDGNSHVTIDLSRLRSNGHTSTSGLVATGPVGKGQLESFYGIYVAITEYYNQRSIASLLNVFGVLNGTMMRGGVHKNGIITSSFPQWNPSLKEYLEVDITQISGSHKMAIIMDDDSDYMLPDIVAAVRDKSYFLERRRQDGTYANVCEGLFLKDNDTCNIWRINFAKLVKTATKSDDDFLHEVVNAFISGTEDGCELHFNWRRMAAERGIDTSRYIPMEECKQVGIDVMGLANMLHNSGITYLEFVEDLELFLATGSSNTIFPEALAEGYKASTKIADEIAKKYGCQLDRIHTVEPAQSHSFETTDVYGKTTCRGIWPPIRRMGPRQSQAVVNKLFNHGKVEIASEVGADLYRRLCEAWYMLMQRYGKAHSISYDLWHEVTEKSVKQWRSSVLPTKYYTEHISTSHLDKVVRTASPSCDLAAQHCSVCEE